MNMYIINESPSVVMNLPKNKKSTKDNVRFDTIIQTFNENNINRRRYLKEDMNESIQKQDLNKKIKAGYFTGELDHPLDQSPIRQLTVLNDRTSHRFLEMGWNGNALVAVAETVKNDIGDRMRGLIDTGIPVGFSFRGSARNLKRISEGIGGAYDLVIPPIHIVTWDCVSSPSHEKARMLKLNENETKTLLESFTYIEEDGYIRTENGFIYPPNDFDMLVETRVINLKNKFKIDKYNRIMDI